MLTPEQEAVVRSVRKLIDFWQISPRELGWTASSKPSKAATAAPAPRAARVLKYRHPRTGETWDGEGSQPPWLREALTQQGYTVDELKMDSPLNREAMQGR
jgi:DNA-binding protein H-NS